MFFNESKRKRLRNDRVQFPEDWVGMPTCRSFFVWGHQHGGFIYGWLSRHVKPENSLLRLRIIGFTLSNARQFYLPLGAAFGLRDISIIYNDDRVRKKTEWALKNFLSVESGIVLFSQTK